MFIHPLVRLGAAAAVVAATAGAASAQTYMRGNGADPETLDQHKTSTVSEANILRDLYEGLVICDAAAHVVPGVAESWETSADGTVWTFTLREDARWSNADPVTAGDFVFSLRRIMDPATGATYADILYPIENARAIDQGEMEPAELGVEAVDPRTLRITLEAQTPYFLELLTHQTALPVHPPSVREHGEAFVRPGNMVSNGAYVLEENIPDDRVVLTKNPEFHAADSVEIEQVEFLTIEQPATCVRGFEAGEIHSCSDLPAEDVGRLAERYGDQVRVAPYLGVYHYAVNTDKDAFADRRVRRAMSMAIDRLFLAQEIFDATMVPAYSWVPPGIGNYIQDAPRYAWADDTMLDREDRAIALMAEAGYGPGNPLEVAISYAASENHAATATAIADMWSAIGIETTFDVHATSAHYAMLREGKTHDVAGAGWIGDYSDPQDFLFLNRADNPGFDYGNYDNPDYGALLDEAARTGDLDARAELLARAERMFLEDTPQIPLLFYSSLSLVADELEGWEDNVQNVHPTRFLSLER